MPGTHEVGPLFLGLISGTSADGIDAALVRFEPQPRLLAGRTYPYDAALRGEILRCSRREAAIDVDGFGRLDAAIGEAFADAASRLIEYAGVEASRLAGIGSHGQTLCHRPEGELPYTVQLGDPSRIVERTGVTTVADFRRRDVAAGGHGAPLMPAFHADVLADPGEDRAVLNLGGIANLTLLPARGGDVLGFDTGPANGLMDALVERESGQPYDAGGALAARGEVDAGLLQQLLDDPWFALPGPKSTGRDQFHLDWVQQALGTRSIAAQDLQATLCELSAATIADALRRDLPGARRLVACGGGVHNAELMRRLQARLPGVVVESSSGHGLDPDYVEAMGFAWLARQTLSGLPGNCPSVSGARGPRILGAIHPA